MKKGSLKLAILGGAAALFLCQPAISMAQNGATIFKSNCSVCHGDHGEGSATGKSLGAPDLGSKAVQSKSDTYLENYISNGHGAMPAWKGVLSPAQIKSVVAHIRTFAHK